MAMDFVQRTDSFEVWRRRNTYIFVAPRFGVVMRAKDLSAGMHEIKQRIASVAEEFKEAGFTPHDNAPELDFRTRLLLMTKRAFNEAMRPRNLPFNILLAAAVVAALSVGILALKLPGHTVPFMGSAGLGQKIGTITIPSNPDERLVRWLTSGDASIDAEGIASGGSNGQIYQELSVPLSATVLFGKIGITADTWLGAVLVDLVWYAGEREVSREVRKFEAAKDHYMEVTFQSRAPALANHLLLNVRTWQPPDGRVKVYRAVLSWYNTQYLSACGGASVRSESQRKGCIWYAPRSERIRRRG